MTGQMWVILDTARLKTYMYMNILLKVIDDLEIKLKVKASANFEFSFSRQID
jgi:hypothetical protein